MAALARQAEVKQALEELAVEFEEMAREIERRLKAAPSDPEGNALGGPKASD